MILATKLLHILPEHRVDTVCSMEIVVGLYDRVITKSDLWPRNTATIVTKPVTGK